LKISVKDAQLSTVAVEIKSLTVSGKQVTLAVFRQLEIEPLINEDLSFAGLPWGRVNYFPPPCSNTHLHVVWQKGDELRRACVQPTMPQAWRENEWQPVRDAAHSVFAAMVWAHPETFENSYRYGGSVEGEIDRIGVVLDSEWAELVISARKLNRFLEDPSENNYEVHQIQEKLLGSHPELRADQIISAARALVEDRLKVEVEKARQKVAARYVTFDTPSLDESRSLLVAARLGYQAKIEEYSGLIDAIQSLPQLFIAV
jgi:hypothetical protein